MKQKLSLILLILSIACDLFSQNLISKDLPLYDVLSDNEITMNSFNSHRAVVLVFTSIHCPYSKLYKDRVTALSEEFADKNVRFFFINANVSDPTKNETIADMKQEAATSSKKLRYYADKDHRVRKSLKVEKNPEVIILTPSSEGFKKVYQGAIDDSPQAENMVKNNYVKTTLNDLLSNKSVAVAYQKPVGCRIR